MSAACRFRRKAGAYSINRGLWGTTWGGGWTHDTWAGPPDELLEPPADAPAPARDRARSGTAGCRWRSTARRWPAPISSNGWVTSPARYGIGRNIHVGETALGIKGRIGFEAGAALAADRGAPRAREAGAHQVAGVLEGPARRGSTATGCTRASTSIPRCGTSRRCITSSQQRVAGETRVRLAPGRFQVVGTRSPHSMMDRAVATYGEENRLWTGDEARAFARIAAVPSLLAARAAPATD